MRVNADHWAVLLDFLEKHPSLITNKVLGLDGKKTQDALWVEITNLLNSLGYGEKTKEEWKKTLTDWKSKTKAKAGAIKDFEKKTGGGPSCSQTLSSFELRLLNLMGTTAFQGNVANREIGIKRKLTKDEALTNKKIVLSPISTALRQPTTTRTASHWEDTSTTFNSTNVLLVRNEFINQRQCTGTLDRGHNEQSISLLKPLNRPTLNIEANTIQVEQPSNPLPLSIMNTVVNAQYEAANVSVDNKADERYNEPAKQPNTASNKSRREKSNAKSQTMAMHRDIMGVLREINMNIASLAGTANELVQILRS